ncbi:restriction endonuclease [Paenibacillus yanchengensis]|uniref:Restriction endonuclease n=1 Tax=Paenibacillus yanchengensis TaxID=2035833 RepID=A0ABW4YJE3_9BACL
MNSELSQFVSESFIGPLVFIIMCSILYVVVGLLLYRFIFSWVPEVLIKLIGAGGLIYLIIFISGRFDDVRVLVSRYSGQQMVIAFFVFFVLIAVIIGLLLSNPKPKSKKRTAKSSSSRSKTSKTIMPRKENKSDQEILNSSFDQLSGAEFERLLALYFRDQGYKVEEVGVGGNDGGVDLVIIDQRGEKTAIQAKCYADHNKIGVSVVRELVGAKRNHDCILSLLITTSDLTGPAKKEADQFKVEYWHGGLLDHKLRAWGKWQPDVNKRKNKVSTESLARAEIQTAQLQTAATKDVCSCGAKLVLRKSREGKQFYGCSTFPKCRVTRSM